MHAAFAQEWPTRQIQVFVPQSPGSALDIVTRAVMEQVSTQVGQPIIVENRTGAGNTIAMAAAARDENEILKGRIAALEAKVAGSTAGTKRSSKAKGSSEA